MTGGQAIVRSMRAHGVDTVFGLPGVQLDHLFNALHDEGNAIRVLQPRHEQGAGYMALGYAQSTGRPGVYAVVPGPGLLNTTAALATAYACHAPVLALTGQIAAAAIDQGYGLLHEIPDQLGLIRRLTKWAARIDHPSAAPRLVGEAFAAMLGGVRGPVEVEMAMDTLGVEAPVTLLDPQAPPPPPEPDPEAIVRAAKLLAAAERPLIVCGGGAVDAADELLRVAEMLQAPVVAHRLGRGVVSDRHYLSHTQPVGHRLWADADAVLAVGTRLQQHRMTWGTDANLQIVRIDLEPTQMYRLGRPAVGIVADAAPALAALADALETVNRKRPSRKDELEGLKAAVMADLASRLGPQCAFIDALRAALPEDGFFVDELTQVGYVARSVFPVYRPRSYVSTGYQGTLGAGFATALGVKVANPDRAVLSISGDGGFMFNVQELASAVQHGIDVVAVVFDDGAYGNVRRMQEDLYGGRVIASDLRNPDFVKLAESFGAHGTRVETPAALRTAVERALARPGTTLIHVPVGKLPDPWGVSQPMSRARP
ncbi:MAG: hypothetical protein H6983_22575 [Ectothiorhodospiraceae bacterium]|nr:hypothetical protein [Chromatiales bacterium]MCP5156980.1 hypothetical protein [Ectothiorhodospiraceae bacterium]